MREQGYKGFYVAIGCQRGRKPGITGENAKGTYAAVDFLREAGAKESNASHPPTERAKTRQDSAGIQV